MRPLFVISYKAIFFLIVSNFVFGAWMAHQFGTPWSWEHATTLEDRSLALTDALLFAQFGLGALTLDQLSRKGFVAMNKSMKNRGLPMFFVQLVSLTIYALFGLAAYLTLFEHSLESLLAASGMLSLAVGYLSKDLIQDVLCSVQIQADGLVSIGDWVHLNKMGEKEIYKVVDIDRRMTTLENLNGYRQVIRNGVFYDMRLINLSRQENGSRRKIEIDLDAQAREDEVLQILSLSTEKVIGEQRGFHPLYFCSIREVTPYRVTYTIDYFCWPELSLTSTDHAMMQSALRFLRSAGLIELSASLPAQIEEMTSGDAELRGKKYINQTFNQQLNVLVGTSGYSFMRILPLDILVELAQSTKLHHIQAGEQFITKGANGNSMYIVSRGSIEIRLDREDGSKTTLATLWPGDCLGEMSLLTGAPRSADAVTKTEATLLEISSDDLSPVLHKYPSLANAMAEAVLLRNNQMMSAMSQYEIETNESPKSLLSKIVSFFKIKKSQSILGL